MQISKFSNVYNIFPNKNVNRTNNNFAKYSNSLHADVVSFSAKKYDAESIINPTNHCAYCGEKVYNEQQIDSLAKEMLSAKADRLEGNIKSVLEKLDGAKNAQDLALAKRLENQEQIDFFKNFMDIASKKSFLKGEAIFEQVYNLSRDEAYELLVKNLHPLQRTIDHVSPQKEDKENNSSDVNLVEACYCCNHDLKKGVSFNEFYTMFPSIKNNMPKEKFDYASAGLLDSSQSNILQRLSAANMLKFLERLFMQRTEAANYLDSIDFRIKSCNSSIEDSVKSCEAEIKDKEKEIDSLSAKHSEMLKDDEYVALCERISLSERLDSQKNVTGSLRDRRQKVSNALNELRNPPKTSKKASEKDKKDKMTKEEKEKKIAGLKANLDLLQRQITSSEEKETELGLQIMELDEKFPTIDMLQAKKSKMESIVNAHISLIKENAEIKSNQSQKQKLQEQEAALLSRIENLPKTSSRFKVENYSNDEQAKFNRWQELTEALAFIDEHPNGGAMKALINQAARLQIVVELESLKGQASVVDYNDFNARKQLESELSKVKKSIAEIDVSISQSQRKVSTLKNLTSQMSQEEAQSESKNCAETIRRLTDKQNFIKLPQRINTLKAEITLLRQTIQDLYKQQEKIKASYNS